jgi:hypothetical protein
MYTNMYVSTFIHIIHMLYVHIYIYIRIGRVCIYSCISVHADGSAVCAHAVVGLCCGLGSALHMLSSGSSVHVTAQSINIGKCVYP